MLEEDYADSLPADARILIDRIDASASRMNTLIDDLLVFARLGRQAINKQTLQPVILIQSVLKEMEAETAGRKVDFQIEDLPECEADPSLLKQVWVNLVSNALKYSRHEEETHITIGSLLPPGSSVPVYFIRDNGVGFDMQYAEKLFGVFQRLHSTGEFEGTGVGLAIVQSIIQHHGGRIWAEAEVNQGATFYFTLA